MTQPKMTTDWSTSENWRRSPLPLYRDVDYWRTALESGGFSSILLEEAREEADKEPPMLTASHYYQFYVTGERGDYQTISRQRRKRLGLFTLAACLSREQLYLDRICDEVWAICEESTWVAPAHLAKHYGGQPYSGLPSTRYTGIDLFASVTAAALAECIYVLKGQLHPLIEERVRDELERRIFRPVREQDFSWMKESSNWTAVCAGGILTAGLWIERDKARLDALIGRLYLPLYKVYVSSFTDDGGISEGIGCWNFGFKYFLFASQLLECAADCGWKWHEQSHKFRQIAHFPVKVYMGAGVYPLFSEPPDRSLPFPWLLAYIRDRLQSEEMAELLTELETEYRTEDVLRPDENSVNDFLRLFAWWQHPWVQRLDAEQKQDQEQILIKDDSRDDRVNTSMSYSLLPQLQWMIVRGVGTRGYAIAAKGGHNGELHNHNDVGNYVVYGDRGEAFVAELARGALVKSYFEPANRYKSLETNSFGHNVPSFDQIGQSAGAVHTARDIQLQEPGAHQPLTWSLDMTAAYPPEAGLQSLRRTWEWSTRRRKGAEQEWMMRVIDDIRLRISLPVGAIVEPLYTYADRIDEQSGVVYLSFNSGRSIAIHYDASQWSCRIVDASPELSRSRDYPVHRIEWRNIQKTTAIKFELKYCGEGQADGNETYG